MTKSPRHNAHRSRITTAPRSRNPDAATGRTLRKRDGHDYHHPPVPERVVVIGAGMVGLSTAWFLQERGVEVTVLDRDGVAAGVDPGATRAG